MLLHVWLSYQLSNWHYMTFFIPVQPHFFQPILTWHCCTCEYICVHCIKACKMHSKSLWLNLTCWTRKCVQYSQTVNTLALVWWEGPWCQWCAQDNPDNGKRKINIISNSTNGKLLCNLIHTASPSTAQQMALENWRKTAQSISD